MVRSILRISLVLSIAVSALTARPVWAQITTGTLSGSVRDAQGAVVPGATVTLVSTAARHHDRHADEHRRRLRLSERDRRHLPGPRHDGRVQDARTARGGRQPGRPRPRCRRSRSRSARWPRRSPFKPTRRSSRPRAVSGRSPSPTRRSRTCRSPIAASPAWRRSRRVSSSGANPSRIGGGGQNNIMMDGISTMDTGNNGILLQMNVESIAEVKVLTSSYQAEYGRSSGLQITAVTKSGTNRFRGSVYGVFRDSDWNANSRTNVLNGDPKTVLSEKDLGLLDRRSGRQAGRQQQAVLLLQPRVRAADRRQQRRALPHADGARTGRRLLAVVRQQRRAVSVHQGSAAVRARARPPARPAASTMAACSAGFPPTASIRPASTC